MVTTISGTDWKSAPEDYAALHRIYFPFMVNLVAKNGIDENNKEDVASEIFVRLIERGFLEQFNPDLVFDYQGEKRPARFKSFLARAVTVYVRGHYDKQKRITRREIQICDLNMADESSHQLNHGDHYGSTWADLYGDATPDPADLVIELVTEEQDARGIREFLAHRDKRCATDTCDLVRLYDVVRQQILDFGDYDVKALESVFGISTTTAHNWMHWLKANMAAAYGRPCPPKRRRVLRTKTAS